MATYLIPYNPEKWKWDDIDIGINNLNEEGRYIDSWSCSNTKRIQQGDRIFLMRLGVEPKGIIASGIAYEGFYPDIHWDDKKKSEGRLTNYIDIDFDTLLNADKEPILTLDKMYSINTKYRWTSQSSGITIPEEITIELEKQWSNFTGKKSTENRKRKELNTEEITNPLRYNEGAVTTILVNKYERNINAREKCLEHYGYDCYACGMNMEKLYGDAGKEFIHVHHIVPLCEIKKNYSIDPINDLRPICPNCHAIIHRRKPYLTMDELKEIIK
ncbi:HNH endonuclease [Clostridium paraputrificum]|uniref:HNH endonuclease n=1 Tax=Clostridium paraputrificum TaxID=29363 RepID=UPI003D3507CD